MTDMRLREADNEIEREDKLIRSSGSLGRRNQIQHITNENSDL